MDVEGYIKGLSAEGGGSAGRITVDLDRALAMTAHLSFPDRDGWVLKFVQAALAAGASQVRLHFEEDQWFLRHDGSSVYKLNLIDGLGKEGPKKQMALCLRAAWQDPASEVALITSYAGQTCSLTLPGEGVWKELAECPWGNGDGTLLVCRWRTPQTLTPQRIRRFRDAMRLAPVPIWLDRDCINEPIEGDRRVPGFIWPAAQLEPRALALAPANTKFLVGSADWAAQADSSGREGLDWRRLHDDLKAVPARGFMSLTPELGVHHIRLVHFGVEIDSFKESLPGASTGLVSLISTQGLQLDATGCKVVDDSAFKARREQLGKAYGALFKFFESTAAHTNIVRIFKGY
jgi:hypothetical protein